MSEFHIVAQGDTLTKIAKQHNTSVSELQKINGLRDANTLALGQKIALKKETMCAFDALFLDCDRNPIGDLSYSLEFNGKIFAGTTGTDGKAKRVVTDSPEDMVRVLIKRFDGSLKEVASVVSGYGTKFATFISPLLVVDSKLEAHPTKPGTVESRKEALKPAYDRSKTSEPTTEKKRLGPTTTQTRTPDGKPLVKVKGDIPDLSFFGDYVGGEITKEDIEAAAKDLKCEAKLIYAIAKQESGKSSFIKIGARTVPTILYERHWFRKLTKPNKTSPSPYEEKYHDICGPAYHKTGKKKVVVKGKNGRSTSKVETIDTTTGAAPVGDDIYAGVGLPQYKRLVKAYQLDKSAALQACSWGKFQIMGFNFKDAGYVDVFSFVKDMCTGDPAHIKAFLKFAKSNSILLDGLQTENFEKIAEGHNGAAWRSINSNYASSLEKFSKEYIK
jgi:LysM repeat protein